MKITRQLVLGSVVALLGCGLLGLGVIRLSGIRHVYFRHVIATVEIVGLESPAAAAALERRFQQQPQVRETTFARTSWSNEVWMARIQFKASDPAAGARQMQSWLGTLPVAQTARLVRATFYDCRLSRPQRGDIVVGKPQPLPRLNGT